MREHEIFFLITSLTMMAEKEELELGVSCITENRYTKKEIVKNKKKTTMIVGAISVLVIVGFGLIIGMPIVNNKKIINTLFAETLYGLSEESYAFSSVDKHCCVPITFQITDDIKTTVFGNQLVEITQNFTTISFEINTARRLCAYIDRTIGDNRPRQCFTSPPITLYNLDNVYGITHCIRNSNVVYYLKNEISDVVIEFVCEAGEKHVFRDSWHQLQKYLYVLT